MERAQSPGNQNAHRTDWAWSQNERTNERYPKWNNAKYSGNQQGNQDSKQQFGTKGRNNKLEQSEETRIQKIEEKLRNLWDNFKHSNIQNIGVPEGEEQQQEIENLFEQIMEENSPNLV